MLLARQNRGPRIPTHSTLQNPPNPSNFHILEGRGKEGSCGDSRPGTRSVESNPAKEEKGKRGKPISSRNRNGRHNNNHPCFRRKYIYIDFLDVKQRLTHGQFTMFVQPAVERCTNRVSRRIRTTWDILIYCRSVITDKIASTRCRKVSSMQLSQESETSRTGRSNVSLRCTRITVSFTRW